MQVDSRKIEGGMGCRWVGGGCVKSEESREKGEVWLICVPLVKSLFLKFIIFVCVAYVFRGLQRPEEIPQSLS